MGSVLETLLESRKSAAEELETRRTSLMEELDGLVHDGEGSPRTLSEDEETRSTAILAEIDQIDAEIDDKTKQIEKRIKQEQKRAKREARLAEARSDLARSVDVSVTSEPLVYGVSPDGAQSPNSFYGDLARRALAGYTGNDGGASGRLSEWAHQVEVEVAQGSKLGKGAEVQLRELNREFGAVEGPKRMKEIRDRGRVALDAKQAELPELRTGVATGGGTTAAGSSGGAAFVTPIFTTPDYVPYRELGRAFIDQCHKEPLPEYGMTVYTPAVQSAIEVAAQTEGSAVNETTNPSFGFLSGSLTTEAGQQFVTQQLLDRAGPNFAFDRMIFDQLERNYGKKIDTAVLEAALVSATSQSWTGSSGAFVLLAKGKAGGFVGQVGKAKADMRVLAGTVLNPTHLFLTQTRWEFIAAYTDENGRPLINPDYAGPFAAAAGGSASGDEGIEGSTGYRLAGLPVFQDGNIPLAGTTTGDQAIVGDLQEVWVYEGPAVTRVLPQTKGTELLVLLQRYSYYTVIKRYAKAITVITGTGLSAPSYTT